MGNPRASAARGFLAGAVGALFIALVVGVIVGGPLVLGHRQDLPLERAYGDFAVGAAARLGASGVAAPTGQVDVSAGRSSYTGSCSQCHGANGDGLGALGLATYPPATDLRANDTQKRTDAELFWIVQNGLSFTGMPGYRDKYQDRDILNIVAFVRALKAGQSAVAVPSPTAEQLAVADPFGDAVHRGAAVYFAQNCAACHGAVGNAPGNLALREAENLAGTVRRGRRGMPAYSTALVTDAQLADLSAYTATFAGGRGGRN